MTALIINDLHKIYPDGRAALKGISFSVEPGDFFGLLGPNGAGKTTTIGIITSLVKKTQGDVTIFGKNIDTDFAQAKTHIGVMPQEFNFNIFKKVIHIILDQAGYYGIPRDIADARAEKFLHQLGLWDYRNTPAGKLSGGLKRRLMIVRALIHAPELLILDEPTAGVDVELRRVVWQFLEEINREGTTIILTTHYLEEAESLCKKIAIIHHGKIIVNTDTLSLLQQLKTETFVFYLRHPIRTLPEIPGYVLRQSNDRSFEVDINHTHSLNHLFSELSHHRIEIESMRNKTTRLEELFLRLTKHKPPEE